MKIGETIVHNGVEAVLVEGEIRTNCFYCVFQKEDCDNNGLLVECGNGHFVKQVKTEEQ